MSEIVVGLDLSPSSEVALKWAADYARMSGQPVRAVHAMPVPSALASVGVLGMPSPEPLDDIDEVYRRDVEEMFASVSPEPGWRLDFFVDDAGPALVAAGAEAAVIVVGTREHTGIGRLIYGSVSRYCLSHARCPIVAVPPPQGQRGAARPADPEPHPAS
ncbi:MAG: universal stress protein [Microlunatus sp.]|nr:universal stress protein [Microlunatus sp.]MDN5771324.1 universal stress protein [Microlunatus sp.]MDN5803940.1 universal stress protein [Microlunatus sp.]